MSKLSNYAVMHLSTSDIDGGAARAAFRLHRGLREHGVNSQMLVRAKASDDRSVKVASSFQTKLAPTLDKLPLRHYSRQRAEIAPSPFSPQWFPDSLARTIEQSEANIVHLHWICNGFLQIESLRKMRSPLVWTLHDMWPFTGGCHYNQECDRYTDSCGKCPQLGSSRQRDLSQRVLTRKKHAWRDLDLTIVTPSRWFKTCAAESALFRHRRIEVIPHGLDTERFQPYDPALARQLLALPQDKKLILFGASSGVTNDERKGFQYLKRALLALGDAERSQIELVMFGISWTEPEVDVGCPVRYLGRLKDDLTLALAYSAADVMVVPSKQESFGQTASEALACGTPVVAFRATGLMDIVEHEVVGYLADPFEAEDLARGITWVLADRDRYQRTCRNAREKVEREFTLELQAKRHLDLYTELLSRN